MNQPFIYLKTQNPCSLPDMVSMIEGGKHVPSDFSEHPDYRSKGIDILVQEIRLLAYSPSDGDKYIIQESLRSAADAANDGNYGIGSVVMHGQSVIAHGRNQRRIEDFHQDIAHAEVMALQNSWSYRHENPHISHEMVLGTSIESCPMCTVATVNSHIKSVVVGVPDPGGSYLLQCPDILPRDMKAIWEKHDMVVRLSDIPESMRELCWDIFLATRHRMHEHLHQTN